MKMKISNTFFSKLWFFIYKPIKNGAAGFTNVSQTVPAQKWFKVTKKYICDKQIFGKRVLKAISPDHIDQVDTLPRHLFKNQKDIE